ncbi:RNA-guided endonuclease TnpB family protein [Bacillus mexicanus]|uniref:RNA-guided endonuclease TnpB family protein n=1 Tax=Bacillus mexicanus TaxID=2834415 RepID=UPI003D1BF53B
MLRHRAYKFRIYPTKEQQILIHKTFGSCRFLFNHFLHEWNQTYEKTGKGLSYNACANQLPQLKNTYIWLKEIDSTALQSSVRFLSDSFTRFFKKQNRALLAKKKNIKLIDAKNYQKQKIKVARLHEKVKNQRQDFLHKLSTDLVKNHDVIVIEDLHTEGMLKNRKLSKAISDVSWSEFVSMITYKADWYGKTIIKIDRWFPSSQICNNCGHQDGPKPLNIRTWTCNNCGCAHDRDINAAMNIKNEGLRLIAGGINGVA